MGAARETQVVVSGNLIYGMTSEGGSGGGDGVLYSYDLSTGMYNELVPFSGNMGPAPGTGPQGRLLLVDSLLYGTAANGGQNDSGVIFTYDTTPLAPTPYNVVVNFGGGVGNPIQGTKPGRVDALRESDLRDSLERSRIQQ